MTTPSAHLVLPVAGDRVQLHPSTDAWMRGDRYGTVERTEVLPHRGPQVYVRMDRSHRLQRFRLMDVQLVT